MSDHPLQDFDDKKEFKELKRGNKTGTTEEALIMLIIGFYMAKCKTSIYKNKTLPVFFANFVL